MDTRQQHTAAQSHMQARVRRAIQLLRQCYQSFLLHLVLSLSVACVLLLSVIGFSSYLPHLTDDLTAAAVYLHRPQDWSSQTQPVLSEVIFSQAVYLPSGTADCYFDAPTDAASVQIRYPAAAGTLLPDPLYREEHTPHPLDKPSLDTPVSLSPSTVPAGHIRIRPTDLSQSAQFTEANSGILFSNQTNYPVEPTRYLTAAYPIPAHTQPVMTDIDDGHAPLVLILHTHGTEAYAPDGAVSVPRKYAYRSEDTDENVVSVGAVLAETLEDAGIPVLHCTTMFDAASYNDSYVHAAAYIRETVAAYPSIAYVFDVHRDALESTDGSMLRPVTTVGAEVCAQVMSVVGTDSAGAHHPDWEDNLTVAVQLQKRLNDAYNAFARPINLRTATFNAQYAPGSLLLEIGAAGNSVIEARSAAYHLGVILAELILNP